MGAVPVQEANPVAVGEPGHVADVGEDPRGAGRADPVDAQQPGPGGGHRLPQPAGQLPQLAVQDVDLADQLGGQLAAGPSGRVATTP